LPEPTKPSILEKFLGEKYPATFLVSYFVGEENVFALTTWKKETNIIKLDISPRELRKLVTEFIKNLSECLLFEDEFIEFYEYERKIMIEENDPSRFIELYKKDNKNRAAIKAIKKDSHELFKLLLGSLDIPEEVCFFIFSPDDDLAGLPFDVLRYFGPKRKMNKGKWPERKELFFFEEYFTSYHFSFTHLYRILTIDPPVSPMDSEQLFVGVASDFKRKGEEHNDTNDTREIDEEVETISKRIKSSIGQIYPQNPVHIIQEKNSTFNNGRIFNTFSEFTIDDFIEALSNTLILHFAVHGEKSDDPKIQVSKDLVIGAAQIEKIKNVQLLVLGACNTGTGNYLRGEGLVTLSRLFLSQKSIKNVVHTLLPIGNKVHKDFIILFYKFLLQPQEEFGPGLMHFPIALVRAKREFLEKMKKMKYQVKDYELLAIFAGPQFMGNPTASLDGKKNDYPKFEN